MSQYKSQIQNHFLSTARKKHLPVEIVLNTGTSLRGKIKGYDQFSISLSFKEKVEVIYKSSILLITYLPQKKRPPFGRPDFGDRRPRFEDRPPRPAFDDRPKMTIEDRPKMTIDDRPKMTIDDQPKKPVDAGPKMTIDDDLPKIVKKPKVTPIPDDVEENDPPPPKKKPSKY